MKGYGVTLVALWTVPGEDCLQLVLMRDLRLKTLTLALTRTYRITWSTTPNPNKASMHHNIRPHNPRLPIADTFEASLTPQAGSVQSHRMRGHSRDGYFSILGLS